MFTVIWRTFFLYILIVFSLRFMGKRQLGELQPSELVITIMISNIAAIPIENLDASLVNGVLSIILLICFEIISAGISLKSRTARRFIQGSPAFIIRDGEIDQAKMEKMRYSLDDLMEQLRAANIVNIDDVLMAVIETTGTLSVYPKAAQRPVTPGDLSLPASEVTPHYMLVGDGTLCDDGIAACGLSREWVLKTLAKKRYKPKDVFLMSCNSQKDYKIIPKISTTKRKGVAKS